MTDFRFEMTGEPRRGRVVVELANDGAEKHNLVLFALPEDFPPIHEQLQGDTRRALDTAIASVNPFNPGKTDAFAVDLTPGRYAIVCFLTSPDGSTHRKKGMAEEFRIK